MTTNILSAERLRELLSYNPDTGVFTRLVGISGTKVGDKAGALTDRGYLRVSVDNRSYRAHRIAWLYVHNAWPIDEIDHINGDRADNRLCNLRESTNALNRQNMRKARKDNNSNGLIGASWSAHTKKWVAQIQVNGKHMYLGLHQTAELAHAAYVTAKREHHEFGTL